MDDDAKMLEQMGYAITDLMVRFRTSSLADRVTLRPQLDEARADWAKYQVRLIKEGVITSAQDLTDLAVIKAEIDAAAQVQSLLLSIAHLIAFMAPKI